MFFFFGSGRIFVLFFSSFFFTKSCLDFGISILWVC